jgi:HrpA-like RNA helicase
MMTDIVAQQKEQPWLISSEARAPTLTVERENISPAQQRRQKEISKTLQSELERKRKLATVWAKKNPGREPKRGRKNTGFSAEQFHSMMSVRQRLPAYQLEHEIVNTIATNQITVIAGDTGCGKVRYLF